MLLTQLWLTKVIKKLTTAAGDWQRFVPKTTTYADAVVLLVWNKNSHVSYRDSEGVSNQTAPG